jgi:16S rRNA (cytosine1402-N4)-methyltransferase
MNNFHEPVLLQEVLSNLKLGFGKTIVDCTLGDGGHAIGILTTGAKVLGIDYNKDSIKRTQSRVQNIGYGSSLTIYQGNFLHLENFIHYPVDGFLFDLGYSSYHLEGYSKGVSFQKDEELDMRIDTSLGIKAKDLINALSENQLFYIFKTYGEETYARRIAKEIIMRRAVKEIHSTQDLVEIITSVFPSRYVSKRNPATRVFQALRIVVNQELDNLKTALPKAENLTLPGGRILIITFHSLEDQIIQRFARDFQPSLYLVNGTYITPTDAEVIRNPRSRSAKLYVFEKKNIL